ncbi:hypothetical protein VPH35_126802 [Triticum aestivum]
MGIIVSLLNYANDASIVKHHMLNGGCPQEFAVAVSQCHPDIAKPVVNAEACARATAALRKCFGRNHRWFEHQYIPRLDLGLDEDVKPSPEQVEKENERSWRWWTGMRRS